MYAYTLTSLIVARYNYKTDTYGLPHVVLDGQMFSGEPESDNDKINAYGRTSRGISVPKGTKMSIKAAGIDMAALLVMTNAVVAQSGTVDHYRKKTKFKGGGNGLPYFGVIGLAAVDGGGMGAFGHRAVKLDTFPKYELNGEKNAYVLSESAGYSFIPTGYSDLFVMEELDDETDWVPPVTGVNFKAFFADYV